MISSEVSIHTDHSLLAVCFPWSEPAVSNGSCVLDIACESSGKQQQIRRVSPFLFEGIPEDSFITSPGLPIFRETPRGDDVVTGRLHRLLDYKARQRSGPDFRYRSVPRGCVTRPSQHCMNRLHALFVPDGLINYLVSL